MGEDFYLIAQACAGAAWDVVRYQNQTAHQCNDAENRDGEKGFSPAKMLTDKGPDRHTGHQGDS